MKGRAKTKRGKPITFRCMLIRLRFPNPLIETNPDIRTTTHKNGEYSILKALENGFNRETYSSPNFSWMYYGFLHKKNKGDLHRLQQEVSEWFQEFAFKHLDGPHGSNRKIFFIAHYDYGVRVYEDNKFSEKPLKVEAIQNTSLIEINEVFNSINLYQISDHEWRYLEGSGGFDNSKPGYFYAWKTDDFIKVGISNEKPYERMSSAKQNGKMWFTIKCLSGLDARHLEQKVLTNFPVFSHKAKFDGYRETKDIKHALAIKILVFELVNKLIESSKILEVKMYDDG